MLSMQTRKERRTREKNAQHPAGFEPATSRVVHSASSPQPPRFALCSQLKNRLSKSKFIFQPFIYSLGRKDKTKNTLQMKKAFNHHPFVIDSFYSGIHLGPKDCFCWKFLWSVRSDGALNVSTTNPPWHDKCRKVTIWQICRLAPHNNKLVLSKQKTS